MSLPSLRRIREGTPPEAAPPRPDPLNVELIHSNLEGLAKNLPGTNRTATTESQTSAPAPINGSSEANGEPTRGRNSARNKEGPKSGVTATEEGGEQLSPRNLTSVRFTTVLMQQIKVRCAEEGPEKSLTAYLLDGLEKIGFNVDADRAWLRGEKKGPRSRPRKN